MKSSCDRNLNLTDTSRKDFEKTVCFSITCACYNEISQPLHALVSPKSPGYETRKARVIVEPDYVREKTKTRVGAPSGRVTERAIDSGLAGVGCSGQAQQVVLKTTWDAGAWGLMLADIARHAANAYEGEDHDRAEPLARIRQLFDAEFADPADEPVQI
jgi:hypothetical protein